MLVFVHLSSFISKCLLPPIIMKIQLFNISEQLLSTGIIKVTWVYYSQLTCQHLPPEDLIQSI